MSTIMPNITAASAGLVAAASAASAALNYLTPERNMAKLGEYPFSIKNSAVLSGLRRRRTYTFAKLEPIGAHTLYQDVGKYDEVVDIKGYFLLKKVDAIKDIYSIADKKMPVMLITGNGEYFGEYLILDISEERTEFLTEGEHMKLDFTIKLGGYYGNEY